MLSDAYRRELAKFDTERVLVAWDGLIAKQQIALEKMQVPTMFITDVKADREVRVAALVTRTICPYLYRGNSPSCKCWRALRATRLNNTYSVRALLSTPCRNLLQFLCDPFSFFCTYYEIPYLHVDQV